MPDSKGYYVKPCSRTSIPRVIIGVAPVTSNPDGSGPCAAGRTVEIDHVVTSHSIRTWAGWSPLQTIAHGTPDAFWEWLDGEGWQSSAIHVFAPNAADTLTLLRCWERMGMSGVGWQRRSNGRVLGASPDTSCTGYAINTLVTSQRVTIADYTRGDRRYVWTSLQQYLPIPDWEIASMCGYQEYADDAQTVLPTEEGWTPQNPSALIVRAMQHVAAWWKGHKGGPWASSVGGLAARFLRSRLHPRTLCTHRHDECLSLERAACYGGRVSCWYAGDVVSRTLVSPKLSMRPTRCSHGPVDGPVYSVDVRSMYPHLLAARKYPVKLIGYERNPTTSDVSTLLRYLCVIARVELCTDIAEYPCRREGHVYYPTGRYTTVLAGPELRYALDRGHITAIQCAALYQAGTPFVGAAMELLAARETARAGNRSGEAGMCKLLCNALSGNLAQRRTEWIPCVGQIPPCDSDGRNIQWGPWITTRPDPTWRPEADPRYEVMWGDVEHYRPRIITRFRSIAGLVERLERSTVGTGTLQAAYAYLTAYGRRLIADARSTMPDRSVLLQDTDGLWVTEAGYEALVSSEMAYGSLPGQLRCDKVIRSARIYGPKHYWADGEWTLAGMRDHAVNPDTGVVTYRCTSNPIRSSPTEAPHTITEYLRECKHLTIDLHGRQGEDGWVTPYHFGGHGPQRPSGVGDAGGPAS